MTRVFRIKCRYVIDMFLLETYYFTSLSEYDTLTMKNIPVLSSIFQSRENMYQRIIKQEIYSIDVYEYE